MHAFFVRQRLNFQYFTLCDYGDWHHRELVFIVQCAKERKKEILSVRFLSMII